MFCPSFRIILVSEQGRPPNDRRRLRRSRLFRRRSTVVISRRTRFRARSFCDRFNPLRYRKGRLDRLNFLSVSSFFFKLLTRFIGISLELLSPLKSQLFLIERLRYREFPGLVLFFFAKLHKPAYLPGFAVLVMLQLHASSIRPDF